jgi:hypothetical protein
MRTISALIVSLAMLLPGGGAKAQYTGEELMQNCMKLESWWQRYPQTTIPNEADAATCFGFILAVAHVSSLIHPMPINDCSKGVGPNCRPTLGICFPEHVSFNQSAPHPTARFRPAHGGGLFVPWSASLLFANEVWQYVKPKLIDAADAKQRLQVAIAHIAPVRNEIAHVREVAQDRLLKATVACADVLTLLSGAPR